MAWVVDHTHSKYYGPFGKEKAKQVLHMLKVVYGNNRNERFHGGIWTKKDPVSVVDPYCCYRHRQNRRRYKKRSTLPLERKYNQAIQKSRALPQKNEIVLVDKDNGEYFAQVRQVHTDHTRTVVRLSVGEFHGLQETLPLDRISIPSIHRMRQLIQGVTRHIDKCQVALDTVKDRYQRRLKK